MTCIQFCKPTTKIMSGARDHIRAYNFVPRPMADHAGSYPCLAQVELQHVRNIFISVCSQWQLLSHTTIRAFWTSCYHCCCGSSAGKNRLPAWLATMKKEHVMIYCWVSKLFCCWHLWRQLLFQIMLIWWPIFLALDKCWGHCHCRIWLLDQKNESLTLVLCCYYLEAWW